MCIASSRLSQKPRSYKLWTSLRSWTLLQAVPWVDEVVISNVGIASAPSDDPGGGCPSSRFMSRWLLLIGQSINGSISEFRWLSVTASLSLSHLKTRPSAMSSFQSDHLELSFVVMPAHIKENPSKRSSKRIQHAYSSNGNILSQSPGPKFEVPRPG